MDTLRIFLMTALILVVFGSTEVEAKEPLWSYKTGYEVDAVAI